MAVPSKHAHRARISQFAAACAAAATVGVAATLALPAPAAAQRFETSAGPVVVTEMVGGLEHPWAVAFLPDGRQLITERDGRLLLAENGAVAPITGAPEVRARGQGGLLDVALAQDFAESRLIFLSYAQRAEGGGARTAVARARLNLDAAPPALEDLEVIFEQQPAASGGRHFGSRIVPAPDGTLFVALGDRGQRPWAQDPDKHVGKVVRIRPDGSTPADNPFANGEAALPEIWSLGHRNIQGAALNPQDGALWTLSHGARGGDEINRPEAGKNYGWPVISYGRHYSGLRIGEGTAKEGFEQPLHYWDPSIAPSGMTFYTGDLFPAWRGDVFVGALSSQLVSRLDLDGTTVRGEERLFEDAFGRVRDVRMGPGGALWFLTDEDPGGLYRVTPAE